MVHRRTRREGPDGEWKYSSTIPLTTALEAGEGGQRQAPAALLLGKRTGTHLTVEWVGARAALDVCGKYRPHRDSILGPSSP